MILMSALRKVSVRITLNVKTIKEVSIATVLTVTKETTVATSMSVTVQTVVTRTPNVETRTEATSAAVKMVFMETVTRALWADAWIVIVLKTKNAFQQRAQVVNVKKAFNSTIYLFAKILMSVNRTSATIEQSV